MGRFYVILCSLFALWSVISFLNYQFSMLYAVIESDCMTWFTTCLSEVMTQHAWNVGGTHLTFLIATWDLPEPSTLWLENNLLPPLTSTRQQVEIRKKINWWIQWITNDQGETCGRAALQQLLVLPSCLSLQFSVCDISSEMLQRVKLFGSSLLRSSISP